MSAPSSYDAVLAARYGLDRSPWPRRILVWAVVGAFAGALLWAGGALTRPRIEANTLSWRAGPRSVQVDLEVRGTSTSPVICVIRAQDVASTDIGYRRFTIPAAPTTVTVELPTLFRASSVGVLGCAPEGQELRVPQPDFPPGIAIP